MRVVVIGAGPAGACTAISLRKAGIEVSIVHHERGFAAPGETLHPGIQPLLQRLGADGILHSHQVVRHPGVAVFRGHHRDFVPYDKNGQWRGFQVPRDLFDGALLQQAVSLGARVLEGPRATAVVGDGLGRIVAIETRDRRLHADYFVDASGVRGWLSQQLELRWQVRSGRRIAYYGYVRTLAAARWAVPEFHWQADGWCWLAQLADDRVGWVRLFVGQHSAPDKAWFPRALRPGQPLGHRRAVDVTWRQCDRPAGPNYFLVGDAAAVLDPAASKGVLKACMGGVMVGHLLGQGGHVPRAALHKAYRDWVHGLFEADRSELAALYASRGFHPDEKPA